ncbi:unnamed protein product (macronuclear) [Paramecium tetraurelia]|uniref:Trichocyst matrix protein n=1 Tax=Paramecium tetraurelia TaxID=5888 RepID=A0BFV9_PARTE|nr:uncharacterized protein GSPATT00028461001 [Paramecium tetraurelia]CAK57426.1 unnamed protein product [Paramecium tetraurelia]|eukprot:XP_001424824.1 hypothetical protein (macronuclear) [Paramecium tetraurelia strain d4-2]
MIVALFITTALALQMNEQATLTTEAQTAVREFVQSGPLGKMMFEFAQVEMHRLLAFGRQQEDRLNDENTIWQNRLGDHNARRIQYESLVTEGVDQLLIGIGKNQPQEYEPRKEELNEILTTLKTNMGKNEVAKKNAEALRAEQNSQFQQQANEITEAIKATDDTLEYIKRCSQGSFIEVDKINDHLLFLQKKSSKSTDYVGSIIQALMQISEKQNFADREVQKQLVDLLQSLRGYFVETLQAAYNDEDQQKLLHENRMNQLENEKQVFEKQYSDAYAEREQRSLQIEDTNRLLDTRGKELAGYQDRLTTENNNFSQNQKIHDDLVAAISGEIGFIEKALDVLMTQAFSDELQSAINKAK